MRAVFIVTLQCLFDDVIIGGYETFGEAQIRATKVLANPQGLTDELNWGTSDPMDPPVVGIWHVNGDAVRCSRARRGKGA